MSSALATGGGDGGSTGAGNGGAGAAAQGAGGGGQAGSQTQAGAAQGAGTGGSGTALGGSSGTGAASNWRDSLPDDLKNDPTLAKYSDVQNLAKAYLHAQQAIGKKGVIRPADNATPEEWKAFKEAIGVPGVDKYEVGELKGVQFPKESLDWAKKMGAEIGILPSDMNKLLQSYAEFEIAGNTAKENAKKEADKKQIDALQKEWGDKYGTELKRGLFAFEKLADMAGIEKGAAMKWMDSSVGNDPIFIKMVAAASKLFTEDSLRENGIGSGSVSSSELSNQIKEVQGQLLSLQKNDPRRPGVLARFESLSRQMTGGR